MTQVEDNIPPSAKPLAPYLRSCQEVLRIRQALTLQLQSHIVSANGNDGSDPNHVTNPASHLSLVVPNQANTNVTRIPSEVTGVRKEYLKERKPSQRNGTGMAAGRARYDGTWAAYTGWRSI